MRFRAVVLFLHSSINPISQKTESECFFEFDFLSYLDEDDWKKKNPSIKLSKTSRRSKHSMLNPNVELCSGIMLLKNGWANHGNASLSIQTSNTCAFDSLYFAVAAMYSDYGNVRNQIDHLAPECAFSNMVRTMFQTFSSHAKKHNSLHQQRNNILQPIFQSSQLKFDCGLILINCAANVNYIIPKVLPVNLYSYSRTKQCDLCGEEIISNRCFVDIVFEEYDKRSIKNLNSCLLDTLTSESIFQESKCPKSCKGSLRVTNTLFSNFIIIDLHLATTIRKIALSDIPKELNILGEIFALTACIEFIGETTENISSFEDAQDSIAHYITHILRSNNQWQTFDDLKSHIFSSKTNLKIKGQVVFYVKKS